MAGISRIPRLVAGGLLAGAAALAPQVVLHAQESRQPPADAAAQRAVLDRYCVGCHNERTKDSYAGLALDTVDLTNAAAHAELLEKVVRKVRTGQMPPAGRRRPDEATRESLVRWVEAELDSAAAANPNPGR
ncbi:MAG: c-type cytochrome, partial [Acidobacteria bacterium]|nr:c-type cytochrome [Acidobacteriota bacterium]